MNSEGVHRRSFQVAYYGADKNDHTISAEALGPALIGFSKLLKEANRELNGDRATVDLFVTSDFEHKCFHINFEAIQHIIDSIRLFLGDEDATATLGKILTAIGILGGATKGLFAFLKWKNGKPVTAKKADANGNVTVNVKGDHNTVQVTQHVWNLSTNKKVLEAIDRTLEPIESNDADSLEFKQNDKKVVKFEKDDVKKILASVRNASEAIEEEKKTEVVKTWLRVYSPVFDTKAKQWRFDYEKHHIYADISDTNIAEDAIKRGGSFVNDKYRVKMEITPSKEAGGTPSFKILEVLDYDQAPQQTSLTLKASPKRGQRRKIRTGGK